jgi:hypothetical protein
LPIADCQLPIADFLNPKSTKKPAIDNWQYLDSYPHDLWTINIAVYPLPIAGFS